METTHSTASIIMAAGRGSRMTGFEGNKTLLPLLPGRTPFEGSHPILIHILDSLPPGPKSLVVHHRKEEVMAVTRGLQLHYSEQPVLNGTGGALLAAREFIQKLKCETLIITMGDVPLVKRETYDGLVRELENKSLVVLGFVPESKKQYGLLETDGGQVKRIVEWKYWKAFPRERQASLRICNSGIYAARRIDLLGYLSVLASSPHEIHKVINGRQIVLEEYFITDLVQYMDEGGLSVGYVLAEDETEVMGVDDRAALMRAQKIFGIRYTGSSVS